MKSSSLWQRLAEELLAVELGVTPLAMLGRLPEGLTLKDGLAAVAGQVVERLMNEAPPDRVKKLLTDAYLLTGLRVRRERGGRNFSRSSKRCMNPMPTRRSLTKARRKPRTRGDPACRRRAARPCGRISQVPSRRNHRPGPLEARSDPPRCQSRQLAGNSGYALSLTFFTIVALP